MVAQQRKYSFSFTAVVSLLHLEKKNLNLRFEFSDELSSPSFCSFSSGVSHVDADILVEIKRLKHEVIWTDG